MAKRLVFLLVVVVVLVVSLVGTVGRSEACRPACCGCVYCDSAYYQIEGSNCFIRTWNCLGNVRTEEICV